MDIVENSDGSATYLFTLKDNLTFHDGSPLTAEDVKFSLERMLDPELNSPGVGFFTPIEGYESFRNGSDDDLAGIRVMSEREIEVRTSFRRNSFLYGMALNFGSCVVPEGWDGDPAQAPLSAGPYRIVERTESGTQLERFDAYPDADRHPVDQIAVISSTDQRVSAARFAERIVDIVGPFAPTDMAELLASDEALRSATFSFDWPYLVYLSMNTTQAPLDDVRLRKALNHAIDRARLTSLFSDIVVPVNQILPPQMPGHDPNYQGFEYDPDLARQLVKEATGQDTISIDLYFFANADSSPMVEEIERQLQDSGIVLRTERVSAGDLFDIAGNPETTGMTLAGWSADYLDASNFFHPLLSATANKPGTWNFAHYENPVAEELAITAESLIGPDQEAERLEAWSQAYATIMDDAPWVPLYTRPIQILADERIHPLISDKGMKNLLEFRIAED